MAIDVKYINPFIEASQGVFNDMCGKKMNIGKLSIKGSPYNSSDVVVLIGITGGIRGQVIFNIKKQVACNIASSMMGGAEVKELDELSKSAICELTNMILGNTASIFYNRGLKVDITPPSFLVGQDMQITANNIQTISIPLEVEGSNDSFEIDIAITQD